MAEVVRPDPLGLWHGAPLILASKSRGRAHLLQSAGIPCEAIDSELDERQVEDIDLLGPRDHAAKLAAEKARIVSIRRPDRVVVGADQTLECGGRIFHKPDSMEQALRQLQFMSGETHLLHSAVACFRSGDALFDFVATARIHMRRVSAYALSAYARAMGEKLLETVGSYEIEGLGAHLIDRIEGDMFTVIGLPMFQLLSGLRDLGLIAEEAS